MLLKFFLLPFYLLYWIIVIPIKFLWWCVKAKDTEIQLWHPCNIMGKDVFLYFPRKEIYDIFDKFMYAFNNESLDAYDCIVAAINPAFDGYENSGYFMNDAFFTYLHSIYSEHGKMKCGYAVFGACCL